MLALSEPLGYCSASSLGYGAQCVLPDSMLQQQQMAGPHLQVRYRGLGYDRKFNCWRVRIFFNGKQVGGRTDPPVATGLLSTAVLQWCCAIFAAGPLCLGYVPNKASYGSFRACHADCTRPRLIHARHDGFLAAVALLPAASRGSIQGHTDSCQVRHRPLRCLCPAGCIDHPSCSYMLSEVLHGQHTCKQTQHMPADLLLLAYALGAPFRAYNKVVSFLYGDKAILNLVPDGDEFDSYDIPYSIRQAK